MFLDTSGLFCYFHVDEPHSDDAATLFEASGSKLTHSLVIAELVALAQARGQSRTHILRFLESLIMHPQVETVWVAESVFQDAMSLLKARLDKTYSLCDAVSFVLMRKMGLIDALTTDRHFEQEGFRRLLA